MPAVSHSEGSKPRPHPSSSKHQNLGFSSDSPQITHQPSPAPIAAQHYHPPHVLHRRFIGPMPEVHANSQVAEEKKKRFKEMRKGAMRRLKGEAKGDDKGGFVGEGNDAEHRRRVIKLLRRKRRKEEQGSGSGSGSGSSSEDSESEEDDGHHGRAKPKGKGKGKVKQKRKDVWVGESFDIGQEFKQDRKSPESTGTVTPISGPSTSIEDPEGHSTINGHASSSIPQRPPNSTRTTQESFVTARTQFSDASAQSETEEPSQGENMLSVPDTHTRIQGSISSVNGDEDGKSKRQSGSSSMQLLMGSPGSQRTASKGKERARADLGNSHGTLGKKLKSAMRKSSKKEVNKAVSEIVPSGALKQARFAALNGSPESSSPETRQGRSKSVQFPLDPVEPNPPLKEPTRRGNKAPADPVLVLQREGDAAEGTSAGAVEEAMGEAESDESEEDEAFSPGQVIMRDRMLVRVGYHRDEGLGLFNESTQRRNPCSRMEPFEEYIVAWRKGRVEFYQESSNPVTSRLRGGNLHLCFIVPLLPNRTNLCVFNETDLTLCLTTSAGRLQADLQRGLRSFSTHSRSATYKNRVQQSKQAKWLRTGRRGTHVFILKAHHRSSAVDWFWELWRDLGGELPAQFQVSIPSFSSTVRIAVPQNEDDDMVGSRRVCAAMSSDKTIQQCVDMTGEVVDLDRLFEQRRQEGLEVHPQLELVRKCQEGTLEWLSGRTTLLGHKRDWSVLAAVALTGVETFPRKLELREAKHQSHTLKLEDGTIISEPPGVEGYLTQVASQGKSSRAERYITTQDGHIIISKHNAAQPPIKPGPEGSTPLDLFHDVYDEFHRSELARMTNTIELCDGIIDFRSIETIELVDAADHGNPDDTSGHRDGFSLPIPTGAIPNLLPTHETRHSRRFIVHIDRGGTTTLEARSREIAKEWVERLNTLAEYWKRRQRVDARIRMDVVKMHSPQTALSFELSNDSDALLGDIWNWCVLEGCRTVTLSGRLFMKKGGLEKFRAKYVILAGGGLVTFKIKTKLAFSGRKRHYTLFGAYVYSGMLAQEELHEGNTETLNGGQARVYQDGLQTSDGAEDTTFVVRLAYPRTITWTTKDTDPWKTELVSVNRPGFTAPGLSTKAPGILIFRARSKLERDRWVWAINAEMERQTRQHVDYEKAMRAVGKLPSRGS